MIKTKDHPKVTLRFRYWEWKGQPAVRVLWAIALGFIAFDFVLWWMLDRTFVECVELVGAGILGWVTADICMLIIKHFRASR